MFKKLGGFLKKNGLAILGGVAGGPLGVASVAMDLVQEVTGVAADSEDEQIAALEANPDLIVALKKAQMEHKVELERLALESARLDVEDRANARARETAFVEATGKRDISHMVMGWFIVVAFFGLVYVHILGLSAKADSDVVIYLIGLASGFCASVVYYNFGSSKGSSDKTKMLANKTEGRP